MIDSSLLCLRRGAVAVLFLGAVVARGQAAASPEVFATSSLHAPLAANVAPEPLSVSLPAEAAPSDALPDAPSSLATAETLNTKATESSSLAWEPAQTPSQATPNIAPKLTKYIPSGWTAQTITGHDKVLIGLKDLYSPLDFIAMIASAGYEQVFNGEPNYGTDRGAFGQRLGAAALRESTQGFFTDSVFSPVFHEDPRYYVQGPSHNFVYRTLYAVTRPLITRTDSGHSSVNGALLTGYAASAALSYSYYPQINRNFRDTASTYGGSLGGAALGFFVSEFSDDLLKAVHMRKK